MNLNLFDDRLPHLLLKGDLVMDGRTYRWTLYLRRIPADWAEQVDQVTGLPKPPGWAFEVEYRDAGGVWRVVRNHSRVWTAWGMARGEVWVREVLGLVEQGD